MEILRSKLAALLTINLVDYKFSKMTLEILYIKSSCYTQRLNNSFYVSHRHSLYQVEFLYTKTIEHT